MSFNVRIQCVNKTNRMNAHERIKDVGGINSDGTRWKLTETAAIDGIEQGKWRFWASVNEKSVWVVVASRLGHKYLKTEADGEEPNNLLNLPDCPP